MKNQYNPLFSKVFRKFAGYAFAVFCINAGAVQAQVPPTATGYLFSTSQGTYTPITGGTQVTGVQADDANVTGIPIGFTFPFCTGNYTILSACSNGFLSLSNSNSNTLTNSSGNANSFGPLMMPLWDDLNGSPAGQAFYQTTGTAPNRIFTFEWRSWRWTWSASGNDIVSFQVKLFEKGRIEFHYSEGINPVGGSPSATIGIARNGTDYQTLNNTSTSPTISTATFVDNLTIRPTTGQIYAWDAPLPNNASVVAIPAPTTAICLGDHAVKAQVKNLGGNVISNVMLNWSVNGVVQTPVPYATPIPLGGTSGEIALGIVNFPSSSATRNIKVWTSAPNGNTDPQPENDTFQISRKALDPPGAIVYYSNSRVCPGDSVQLYAPTGPDFTYQWELDADPIPGATADFYYAKQDGFYSVTVFNPGCKAQSTFHKITVKPLEVELGPDVILCETVPPILLDAGEPGSRYIWSTGDTTQSIPVTEGSNKYWVEVKLGQLCIASDTVQMTIEPLPEINGISFVNTGNTYYFAPAGPSHVESYLWQFGDGAMDTVSNPVHTYAVPGPYNVVLTVYNSCGEDTSMYIALPVGVAEVQNSATVTVYPNPAQNIIHVKTTDVYPINNIRVFNSLGAVVYNQPVDNLKETSVNTSSLPAGNYYMVIRTSAGIINKLFQVGK